MAGHDRPSAWVLVSFRAWIYNQARWRIANIFRRRQRTPLVSPVLDDSSTGTDAQGQIADPAADDNMEAVWDKEWREILWVSKWSRH